MSYLGILLDIAVMPHADLSALGSPNIDTVQLQLC